MHILRIFHLMQWHSTPMKIELSLLMITWNIWTEILQRNITLIRIYLSKVLLKYKLILETDMVLILLKVFKYFIVKKNLKLILITKVSWVNSLITILTIYRSSTKVKITWHPRMIIILVRKPNLVWNQVL